MGIQREIYVGVFIEGGNKRIVERKETLVCPEGHKQGMDNIYYCPICGNKTRIEIHHNVKFRSFTSLVNDGIIPEKFKDSFFDVSIFLNREGESILIPNKGRYGGHFSNDEIIVNEGFHYGKNKMEQFKEDYAKLIEILKDNLNNMKIQYGIIVCKI